jgi:hypothetical protein
LAFARFEAISRADFDSFQVTVVTIAGAVRVIGFAAVFVAPLLFAPISAAQDMGMPRYNPGMPPSDQPSGPVIPAPVGHRQPRASDIPQSGRSAAELLEERQQAELTRKLRICRGC